MKNPLFLPCIIIPFIRDVYFLDSKENIGHYGFIRYEELPFTFQGTTDEEISDSLTLVLLIL